VAGPLVAANGTDVGACKEASCQIIVSGAVKVPLAPKFRMSQFLLTHEAPNRLTFDIRQRGQQPFMGYVLGTGRISLATGITVTIERMESGGAVLKFEPKAEDPEHNKASGSEGLSIY
jgi:hypothetical protein